MGNSSLYPRHLCSACDLPRLLAFAAQVSMCSMIPFLPPNAMDWLDGLTSTKQQSPSLSSAAPTASAAIELQERATLSSESATSLRRRVGANDSRTAPVAVFSDDKTLESGSATSKQRKHTAAGPSQRWSDIICGLFTVYMVYLNLGDMHLVPKWDNGDIGEALRINQYWVMFSPDPAPSTGWMVVTGAVQNGSGSSTGPVAAKRTQQVDLLRAVRGRFHPDSMFHGAVTDRPLGYLPAYSYKTFRWQKYFSDMSDQASWNILRYVFMGRFLCDEWDRATVRHPSVSLGTLQSVSFHWVLERHPPPQYVPWSDPSTSVAYSLRAVWVWFNLFVHTWDPAVVQPSYVLEHSPLRPALAADSRLTISKRHVFDCSMQRDEL